ncbi:antibiotic ABC transporter ATP-binding protein [Flavobacterium psychrophilum]|uniref:Probable lipid A transport system, ATPase and permease components n=1 Tax=Flavobacterium psychrophilum (strain ATCC 49511 / DSM 21280 / CIP 103535 / JIP02/86) TaxID=402612 RepID=A6GYQ3_FLAPJ|nr:ABC transporter ATP-binding protein [Flavobacterium psychrophilum]AIG29938.1 antibiotic ABC transporter ATP-binding protein [Flavobacterium psychrophilum]AIG32215.1 antibiotic ABC transporter ATP-binding protein [Flavobacterium psychrophilum]AIG34371.1 antibiotic ABC transporter ATP-binding protein [Flavobacterium psychrophilum]AIG36734.1 antibiotic ABC transporter ATP-binding protein [Flavobacterium psychrophilum]AIG38998.1 antibiotic ABC transporter ATP-binding protein [Flavobacterium psy
MENIKKIIPFVKPYKNHVVWNIFYNILYALFSTLSFIALMPMMQVLFETTKAVNKKPIWTDIWDITKYGKELLYYNITLLDKKDALILVIILIIFTFFFKNIFNYLASYHMMHLQNNVLKDLRIQLFEKIISLPIGFYSEQRKGDVMSRMLGDVGQFQNTFFVVLELIVREPLTILFTIIAMFNISVKLTLFVFVFIPISGFIISRLGKNLKSKSNKAQAESGFFISILEETLGGMKVVKSYNAENMFTKKFTDSIMRMIKLSTSIGNKNNLASPLSEFLGIVTIAILLWYGGKMVLVDHTLEGAVFIVYMALAYNILTPAKAISKASYSVKAGMAAAERVLVILEHENPITSKENAIEKNTFEDKIEIKNINFRYEEENVLKNFTITVPKGKTIALVGQSGSGKSTIANLLTRFYDVNEGNITIDGIDIKDMKLESLRGLMGLVTQDSILFNDTIKNNILLGKENATDEEVIEALKIANAYEFVMNLPNGIETNIGDAGNKLSGGQKQRLSIARAVLKNPPIMILDEATSALDTESEKFVQIALENMMQNRTSIVIAHRLSTIQKADNIIVMKKGEIVEQGTHTELLALNGTYSNLVTMQSFE